MATYIATGLAAVSGPAAGEDPRLSIAAEPPRVEIPEQQAARHGIVLPSLEIRFRIDARCPAPQVPVSLMLSIADSRRYVPANEIGAVLESGLTITVPSPQIAPVFMHDFCTDKGTRREATVPGLLSAQGSLACGSADDPAASINYASAGVDVNLACPGEAGEADSEGENEDRLFDL